MTTDKELLELAAKVAGVRYDAEASKPHPKSGAWFGLWLVFDDEPSEYARRYWNPLTDDGDALRLVLTLGLCIEPSPLYSPEKHSVIVKQRRRSDLLREANPTEVVEVFGTDATAATRRAIVRAAAAVGKTPNV